MNADPMAIPMLALAAFLTLLIAIGSRPQRKAQAARDLHERTNGRRP
jgi:hypothetical protein